MTYYCESDLNFLAHHGVKGMRWGHRRRERALERKIRRVGRAQGFAQYQRSQMGKTTKAHENLAKRFDRVADTSRNQGLGFKSDFASAAAKRIRQHGKDKNAERKAIADRYMKRADVLQAKVNKYADKKHVDIGKDRVQAALKKGIEKGKQDGAFLDQEKREQNARDLLGDKNYEYASNKYGQAKERYQDLKRKF